jgi:secondary thiamine-phosphate synthase enzyme
MRETLTIKTSRRCQMVDITGQVQDVAKRAGVEEGLCHVYSVHTTAAITINEGHDPAVVDDILAHLEKLVPHDGGFRHVEGNSDAHIKVSLVGPGQIIPVEKGRLMLGTWQRIFFCEFDGARTRKAIVTVSPDQG